MYFAPVKTKIYLKKKDKTFLIYIFIYINIYFYIYLYISVYI